MKSFIALGICLAGGCITFDSLISQKALAMKPVVPIAPRQKASDWIAADDYYPLSQASLLLKNGWKAEALPYLRSALSQNPINIFALFNLGCIYLDLAKQSTLPMQQHYYLVQAQQAFEEITTVSDDLSLVYFKLGKIALMRNDVDNAKRYYQAGLRLDPKNAALVFNLGRVYDQNHQNAEAIQYYIKALALDPGFTAAYNNLALLYEESHDDLQAERIYRKALRKDPNYVLARINLANLYGRHKRYEKALTNFNIIIAQEPDNESAYYYRGGLAMRMKHYEQAIADYQRALSLNPEHTSTYYLLTVAYIQLNRMDDALQTSSKYLQLAPEGDYAAEVKTLILSMKLSHN